MKITASIFLFMFFCQLSFGQAITTDIYGKTMKRLAAGESKLGGKIFQIDGDLIIPGGMAVPLTYRRAERGIPDLLVTYTFTEKDSLINMIEYEWDAINFDQNGSKQSLAVQQAFIEKYRLLANELTKRYGQSTQKGDLKDLDQIDVKGGLRQRNYWKPNDSLEIELYSVFSNYEEKKGEIEIKPTNRIRIYVNKTNPRLGDKSVQLAKNNFDGFIAYIRNGNFKAAQAYFSPQIRNQITEDILNKLKESIKPEDFKVYTKEIQKANGEEYLMIQFAYANVEGEPNEIFRVFFDRSHMIIGLQPLSRTTKTN
ncbi:hypothetical protein [Pedobacter sandarakinus]|uniref:hypothetical protein n=1 Tax=Pedobacter sandarakinus TaxID=353156 RepID=UPI002245E8C9|nr:hypothetical protein [Pedobacter sandarakinus]MCX2573642.1 hypothetical protein [Pedobacter sandarakinus]